MIFFLILKLLLEIDIFLDFKILLESENGLSNEAKRLEDEAKVAMADAQRQAEFNLQLMKR